MQICLQCNTEFGDDVSFCRTCGGRLMPVAAAAAPSVPIPDAATDTQSVSDTSPPASGDVVSSDNPAVPDEMRAQLNGSSTMLWSTLAVVGLVLVGGFGWLLGRNRPMPIDPPQTLVAQATTPTSEPASTDSNPESQSDPEPIIAPTAIATQAPRPTPEPTPERPSDEDIETVKDRYQSWLVAWQRMDLDDYMSYYWRCFTQKRAGKRAYGYTQQRQSMAANWAKQSSISVSSDTPRVSTSGDSIVIDADQSYDSTTWWDEGRKHLVWRKKEGDWVIVEESFVKSAGGPR